MQLKPDEYEKYWNTKDWRTEKDVKSALLKLGHEVIPFGICDDIEAFIQIVKTHQPDLVFNMSEAFSGDRLQESNIAALMQLVGVPFTGTGPMSLQLCKDKGLTKVIINYHEIKTPEFLVFKKNKSISLKSLSEFKYPGFVKPLQLESSEGITLGSYVENTQLALERIQYIQNKHQCDVIIEEFIDGREVYVSILGNDKLIAFPPRELFFKEKSSSEPKFATYNSKWNQAYRKKWGIDSGWVSEMSDVQQKNISNLQKHLSNFRNAGIWSN